MAEKIPSKEQSKYVTRKVMEIAKEIAPEEGSPSFALFLITGDSFMVFTDAPDMEHLRKTIQYILGMPETTVVDYRNRRQES